MLREPDTQGPQGTRPTPARSTDDKLPGLNGKRLEELRRAVGVDVLGRLLTAFGASNEPRLARLRAVDTSPEEVGRVAHELQGAAANVGADRLAALAAELAVAVRRGDRRAVTLVTGATIVELELLAHLLPHAAERLEPDQFPGHGCDDVTEGVRVLMVDDAPDGRLLGAEILGASGCSVTVAGGGREALERVLGGDWPDVIVLDVLMPDMDGWETLAAIRADPTTAHLAVVMCSVDDSATAQLRACQLGADGYLAKPYSARNFVDVVTEVAQRSDAELLRIRSSRVRMTSRRKPSLETEEQLSA